MALDELLHKSCCKPNTTVPNRQTNIEILLLALKNHQAMCSGADIWSTMPFPYVLGSTLAIQDPELKSCRHCRAERNLYRKYCRSPFVRLHERQVQHSYSKNQKHSLLVNARSGHRDTSLVVISRERVVKQREHIRTCQSKGACTRRMWGRIWPHLGQPAWTVQSFPMTV